jgi:glycosyltransferase involved in cell wall biosynthesis
MQRPDLSQRTRLALIGPVSPFRGGIAQHTTMLHKAAGRMTDLLTISFSHQYPAWLFPGQSDRDPSYAGHQEPGVEYLINSLSPLSWRLAAKRVLAHQPEIVVMPWWTIYWVFCFWYLARRFRHAGIRVVFLCHNVVEHESAPWKVTLTKQVLKQAHSYLVQSREDERILQGLLPQANISYHPHPLYEQFPEPAKKLARRAGLELLFFGFVRAYKGVDVLIDALSLVPPTLDYYLTLAGEFWQEKEKIVQKIADKSLQRNIEIIDRYLSEKEAAELFHRADLVVLPYRSATGSGVISLAYHYNKPVLITRVGGLPDMVIDGETGLIVSPGSPAEMAAALSAISRQSLAAMAASIAEHKRQFSWDGLVQTILRASSANFVN